MTATGQQFEISLGDQWVGVTEVGANLRGYRKGDIDVTHVNDPDTIAPKSSGAVLMPWPNRIEDGRFSFAGEAFQLALSDPAFRNASHGLAGWIRWTPVAQTASSISLSCDVVPQKGWPFEVRATVTYALALDGLTVTLGATNTGARAMPFGAGSHPYLSIGDTPVAEVVVELDAARYLLVDDRQIPTGSAPVDGTPYDLRVAAPLGERRFDTAFTDLAVTDGRGVARLHAGGRTTSLWWNSAFTTVQVFTPAVLVTGTAIAVEAMTCPANAFNSGENLLVLEPGESWTGQWGITPS